MFLSSCSLMIRILTTQAPSTGIKRFHCGRLTSFSFSCLSNRQPHTNEFVLSTYLLDARLIRSRKKNLSSVSTSSTLWLYYNHYLKSYRYKSMKKMNLAYRTVAERPALGALILQRAAQVSALPRQNFHHRHACSGSRISAAVSSGPTTYTQSSSSRSSNLFSTSTISNRRCMATASARPPGPALSGDGASAPRPTSFGLHMRLLARGRAPPRGSSCWSRSSGGEVARPRPHLRNQARFHSHDVDPNAERIKLTFDIPGEGEREVDAVVGKSLLEVAHMNEIPVEGACEGALACSTCHVVLSEGLFGKLEYPDDEEQDMLDLAPDLTETSRLGCQCIVKKELYENEVIKLPKHTLNFYVDGHKPVGH